MSRTRDIIQEICEIRQRRHFDSPMTELSIRLMALERAFDKHDKTERELVRYFPVALVACIESYCRMVIKDLVNSGEPYLTNADKAKSSFKLDFSLLIGMHGKAVTVGEVVAHTVQISRLEQIEVVFSSLLGKDFLKELRVTTDRWAHEVRGEPATPILTKPDFVFANVAKTFELRHIICHETASAYEVETVEVSQCFESCVLFLRATDELISKAIYPNAPLTQTDMNIAAGKSLNEKKELLIEAITTLKPYLDADRFSILEDAQTKWQLYCDAWANFVAGEREHGGTIWPLIYASAAEATIKRRIEEVNDFKRFRDLS